jgi:hypothetical protein
MAATEEVNGIFCMEIIQRAEGGGVMKGNGFVVLKMFSSSA